MYFPNHLQSNFSVKMEPSEIQAVQQVAIAHGLKFSYDFGQPSKKGHCLSISLNFIKKYFDLSLENPTDPISLRQKVIKEMVLEKGANAACAKTSVIYDNLFINNAHQDSENESTEHPKDILAILRQAMANTLGLSIVCNLEIQGSIEEVQDYLTDVLEDGEYVITLPSHVVTLIKRDDYLFLIDPGAELIEISKGCNDGKKQLYNFLLSAKVPLKESLSLSKVQKQNENAKNPVVSLQKAVLSDSSSMKSTLTPLKGNKDFAKREIIWRDRKYTFIEHVPTGEIYNGNSTRLLRAKMIALTVGRTLVETVARVVYHAAMFVFRGFYFAGLKVFTGRDTLTLQLQMTQSFLDIFRSAVYGIAMLPISFYGIIKPYEGRRLYAKLENSLNRGQSVREKWYTAPCFIPLSKNSEWQSPRMIRHLKRLNQMNAQVANSCHSTKKNVRSLFRRFKSNINKKQVT